MRLHLLLSGGITAAILLFLVAYSATAAGYQTATNGTKAYTPTKQNVTGSIDEARESIYENVSGIRERFIRGSVGGALSTAQLLLGGSFDFGYESPGLARWYLDLSKPLVFVSMGVYGIGWWRDWRRRTGF